MVQDLRQAAGRRPRIRLAERDVRHARSVDRSPAGAATAAAGHVCRAIRRWTDVRGASGGHPVHRHVRFRAGGRHGPARTRSGGDLQPALRRLCHDTDRLSSDAQGGGGVRQLLRGGDGRSRRHRIFRAPEGEHRLGQHQEGRYCR